MKAFLILLVVVVLVGVGIGGGAILLSQREGSGAEVPVASNLSTPTVSRSGQRTEVQTAAPADATVTQAQSDESQPGQAAQLTPEELGDLRQRFQSGDVTPEELAALRDQFQRGGAGGFGGFGGVVGTIESIDGGSLGVVTSEGTARVDVGSETTIRITSERGLSALELGMRVRVNGERGDTGMLEATSIVVVDENEAGRRPVRRRGFFGGGALEGLVGTIEVIEGDTVTINTQQGPLPAVVGTDTVVRVTEEASLSDLVLGMRITANGDRAEDGTLVAASILVVPDGGPAFFGGTGTEATGPGASRRVWQEG